MEAGTLEAIAICGVGYQSAKVLLELFKATAQCLFLPVRNAMTFRQNYDRHVVALGHSLKLTVTAPYAALKAPNEISKHALKTGMLTDCRRSRINTKIALSILGLGVAAIVAVPLAKGYFERVQMTRRLEEYMPWVQQLCSSFGGSFKSEVDGTRCCEIPNGPLKWSYANICPTVFRNVSSLYGFIRWDHLLEGVGLTKGSCEDTQCEFWCFMESY